MSDASWLSDRFFEDLAALGQRRGSPPHIFLAVWCVESGLQPKAVNKESGARGLNQMMPNTLAALGAPPAFDELAAEEQLPWIERLIASRESLNGGPFQTAARYYHSNFFPRTMTRGDRPETVVVARDAANGDERGAYAANRWLDPRGDGLVTLADLAHVLEHTSARFVGAFLRLANAMHRVSPPRPSRAASSSSWFVLFLAGLGFGFAVGHRIGRRGVS